MRTIKHTAQFKRGKRRINLDDILLKAVRYLAADIT